MTILRQIMTRTLITLDPDATLKEAAERMAGEEIGDVLVMDGNRLMGILTDRDIVVRAVAYGHDYGTSVRDYVSNDVLTLDADTDVQEAARQMAERQVRRLPVTEGGKVVGMVSLGDLAMGDTGDADERALEGISAPGGNT